MLGRIQVGSEESNIMWLQQKVSRNGEPLPLRLLPDQHVPAYILIEAWVRTTVYNTDERMLLSLAFCFLSSVSTSSCRNCDLH